VRGFLGRIRWLPWAKRRERVWIRLLFYEGKPVLIGPMERFTAETFIVTRINPNPVWSGRPIVSCRIIGDD